MLQRVVDGRFRLQRLWRLVFIGRRGQPKAVARVRLRVCLGSPATLDVAGRLRHCRRWRYVRKREPPPVCEAAIALPKVPHASTSSGRGEGDKLYRGRPKAHEMGEKWREEAEGSEMSISILRLLRASPERQVWLATRGWWAMAGQQQASAGDAWPRSRQTLRGKRRRWALGAGEGSEAVALRSPYERLHVWSAARVRLAGRRRRETAQTGCRRRDAPRAISSPGPDPSQCPDASARGGRRAPP